MRAVITDFFRETPIFTKFILANVRKLGFDIINGPNPETAIFRNLDINLLLDVGANIGQYARQTRILGYKGRIISFEPIPSVYKKLLDRAKNDESWRVENFGLGDYDGQNVINTFNDTVFSSLLNPTSSLIESTPSLSNYNIQVRLRLGEIC
jgi:FkbM family methyltransferase